MDAEDVTEVRDRTRMDGNATMSLHLEAWIGRNQMHASSSQPLASIGNIEIRLMDKFIPQSHGSYKS